MPSKKRYSLVVCYLAAMTSIVDISPALAARKVKGVVSRQITARSQMLALSCSGCHGPEGRSEGIIPPLYGKSPAYLQTALMEYKSGARPSSIMGRHAKGYSEEEIHLIAEYFGSLSKTTR